MREASIVSSVRQEVGRIRWWELTSDPAAGLRRNGNDHPSACVERDMRRIVQWCAAGGLMVVLGACGASGSAPSSPAGTPGTTPARSLPASPGPTPAATTQTVAPTYLPGPPPELTVPARPLGPLERITGVVGEGVEHGCRLLTPTPEPGSSPSPAEGGTTGSILLLSSDARIVPGARVTVEGHRSQGVATTCQQGVPFTVTRVITAR